MMFRYIVLFLLVVLTFQNCSSGIPIQSQSSPAGGTGIQVASTDSGSSESTSTSASPITKGDPPADNPDRNNGGVSPKFQVDIAVSSNQNSDGTISYTGQVFLPGTSIPCPIGPNPIFIYFNGQKYGFPIVLIDRVSGKFSFMADSPYMTILSKAIGLVQGLVVDPGINPGGVD